MCNDFGVLLNICFFLGNFFDEFLLVVVEFFGLVERLVIIVFGVVLRARAMLDIGQVQK